MKIETGKPSGKLHNVGRKLLYPFANLKPGQCIVLEKTDNIISARNSAYQYAKRNKWQVESEKDSEGIVRIYRTK